MKQTRNERLWWVNLVLVVVMNNVCLNHIPSIWVYLSKMGSNGLLARISRWLMDNVFNVWRWLSDTLVVKDNLIAWQLNAGRYLPHGWNPRYYYPIFERDVVYSVYLHELNQSWLLYFSDPLWTLKTRFRRFKACACSEWGRYVKCK